MKLHYVFYTLFFVCSGLFAQTTETSTPPAKPWKWETSAGANINQASFSSNWKAGGVNSIAWGLLFNGKATYKTNKHDWTNDLQLQYGNIRNETQGLRKNSDRIFFDSKYGYRISKSWNVFASVNFLSQFDAGYKYDKVKDSTGVEREVAQRISGIMSPAYLTEALGLEYKPVDYFSAQLGVGALRQTFVTDQTLYAQPGNDPLKLYGVEKGKNIRNQIVFQMVINFDKEIMKNVNLKTRYMALMDYEKLNFMNMVSRLDASLVAKVNKYINVNLTGVVLFDNDQDRNVQYSQLLALGILYTLSK
jgi:hypothetical protein